MELLTLPTLDVLATGSGTRRGPSFELLDAAGERLGAVTMTDISWDGRLRRWFANPAEYPFTLTVTDAAGGVVLHLKKARENTFGRYLRVDVELADGRAVGHVQQRHPFAERVTFHGEFAGAADAEIASAGTGRLSQGLVVEAEPGRSTVLARVSVDVTAALGARRYRLDFAPDTPVLVRALVLGWTTTVDAQLLPQGGQY